MNGRTSGNLNGGNHAELELKEFNDAVTSMSPLMSEHIEELKKHFEGAINSKRTLSLIRRFEDVVKILVKRDIVKPFDNPPDLIALDLVCNKYANETLQNVIERKRRLILNQCDYSTQPFKSFSNELKHHIQKNIGKHRWRQFARALGIKDGDISCLEGQFPNDPEKCVSVVLDMYPREMIHPTEDKVIALLRSALYTIKRPDLLHQLQIISNA